MKKTIAHVFWFSCCLAWILPLSVAPASAKDVTVQPPDATGWFRRAADQMSLRHPGSAPFHLKVVFHASPGVEFTKKPQIIAGDGVYEETWISPSKWRREVTLGNYHAIEVQSGRDRKVQANSDYEPSRVLMLLEALYNPIPRDLLNTDLSRGRYFWNIAPRSVGRLSYVSIGWQTESLYPHVVAFIFLFNGMLVQSNDMGLLTSWQDEVVFIGKAVPKHLSVKAAGKDVLTADIEISSPGQADPEMFDLDGGSTDAGLTLTPLHRYETRNLENLHPSFSSNGGAPMFVFRFMVDRHGSVKELELVDGSYGGELQTIADIQRSMRWRPAEIDGSPCEVVFGAFI